MLLSRLAIRTTQSTRLSPTELMLLTPQERAAIGQ